MDLRALVGLLAVGAASIAPASAHERWADGSAVPPWVKAQCCGAEDVHHLGPEHVHRVEDGYRVDGYPSLIPASRLQPSPDGDWWIFYREDGRGTFSDVYCFFGPFGF